MSSTFEFCMAPPQCMRVHYDSFCTAARRAHHDWAKPSSLRTCWLAPACPNLGTLALPFHLDCCMARRKTASCTCPGNVASLAVLLHCLTGRDSASQAILSCWQFIGHGTQADYLRVCRQRWGAYTLRCNQYRALACDAPSLFVIPDDSHPWPKSWSTVAKRCSDS